MRIKKMAKKLLATILILTMIAPYIPSISQEVKAAGQTGSKETVVESDGVKYVWYDDISPYRIKDSQEQYYIESPEDSGYVFGGWFQNANDTASIKNKTDGGAWAKFVPDEVFTVKAQISIAQPTTGVGFEDILSDVTKVNLRLVTGVDSLKYNKVVFRITHLGKTLEYPFQDVLKAIDVKDDETKDFETVEPKDVFGDAAIRFATIRITGVSSAKDRYLKDWEVTPLIVTQDGTMVSGVTREQLYIADALSNVTDGDGFEAESDEVTYTHTNKTATPTPSHQFLKGGSDTVYLSGTYTTDGTGVNTFGLAVRSAGIERYVVFDGHGFKAMTEDGTTVYTQNTYTTASGDVQVWVNSGKTTVTSEISTILTTVSATEGNVVWAILDNVLYCNVAGKGAFKVPMTKLCDTWGYGRTYQVGIAGYNTMDADNNMSYKQTKFLLGEKAGEKLIAPTSEITSFKKMGYDPISGAYISEYSTAGTGVATTPVNADKAVGICADMDWPASNTSAAGITIVLDGDDSKSIQYLLLKEDRARLHGSYAWSSTYIPKPGDTVMTGVHGTKNENGVVSIKAAVYDDKLSVLVNDTTTYQVELSNLFGEAYTGEQKISIGLGTYSSYEGTPRFTNVEVYEGQDAINMKMEHWTFLVSSATANKVSYDVTTGTVNATDYGQLLLQGTSDVWEISGTMSKPATDARLWVLYGLGLSSGTNGLRFWEIAGGFRYDKSTTGGYNGTYTTVKESKYVFKTVDTTNMDVAGAVEPMSFKVMVVEDILYFWLNDRLAWRVPVQDMNSAIEADSKYNMALYSWDKLQAEFKNLVVRTGSEVDADFLETMKIAKEARFQNATTNWEMKEDGTIARYGEGLTGWQSVAFNQYSTDIYMTGTWKKTTDTVSDFGIFIEGSDGNRRSVLFNGKGFVVGSNEEGKVEHTLVDKGYVFAQNTNSPIEKMLTGSTKEHDVVYAITNNTLYVKVDDCIAGIIPMSVICNAWTDEAETEFGVGLTYNAQSEIVTASFANAKVKYGNEVVACLIDEANVADNMNNTDAVKMVYNPIDGAYIAKYTSDSAAMYGTTSAATVGIETNMQWHDMKTTTGAAGISVKSATTGKTVEFMLRRENQGLRILENLSWEQRKDFALPNNVVPFDSRENCKLSAVVQNGKLKLMCNGDLAYTFELSEYLDNYNNEDVFLGIATNNSDEGIAYFTDISYYTGDAANALLPNDANEDTSVPECGLSKLENASSTIDESGLNIYRAATRDGVSVATIDGASKEWSISGTMKQPDLGRLLPQGFIIVSGDKTLKLLGDENGFVSVVNDGEWNSDNSNIGSSAAYDSYFSRAERTSTSVDFMFKISSDKIYFYTTNLVWMIDLTSETYGGFTAGSDYVVSFVMEDYALEGSFENVKIQRGSDIEKMFEVDESVGTYGTTTAVISETLGIISKNSDAGETIYFDGKSQTWEIKGTMTQENLAQRIRQGFVVRESKSGAVAKFTAEYHGFLAMSSAGWKYYTAASKENGTVNGHSKYILDESQTRTFARIDTGSERQSKTIDFRIVVKDDVMFVFMNDVLSWRIPLTFTNMGGFTAGSDYQLGVTWLSNEQSDNAALTDTGFIISSVKTGADADTSDVVKYILSSASSEMVSDAVKGEISVNPTSGSVRTLYFASDETDNSSTRWEISGTLSATNIMNGFSVKSADGTKKMFVTLSDGAFKGISLNESWKSPYTDVGWKLQEVDNQYVFDVVNNSNISQQSTNIKFRLLIVDDVFYGWINDELAWELPLTNETFGGFTADTSYCLGLRNLDKGSATWSDLSVKYGTQVQTTQDIYIRDPFVLADNDTYYMYGTTKPYKGSFDVYTSKNMITWERQERCFVADDNFWGKENFWAPEVYKYTYNEETAYYMFASFEGSDGLKGTSVLKADSPLGPFKEWSNGALTMPGHDCIDGTLYIEEGKPYMIYCHGWDCDDRNCYDPNADAHDTTKVMGSMAYVELSPDLKTIAEGAEHHEWFDAKYGDMYNFVTDGPFVYTNNGQKYLLWSTTDQSPDPISYKTMCTPFGKLGETINIGQQTTILYDNDGGHGMVFTDFAGNDCLVIHAPNKGETRAKFFSVTNVENELQIAPK